jgi:AcrR family transcriptional regulator
MTNESERGTVGVRTRLEYDDRREQILVCARQLFRERHHESVSSAEIARAAGVSRALLNHYFGTKRELHREVVRGMLEVPPVPVPAFVEGHTVDERVRHSIAGWLELLSQNAETWLTAMSFAGTGRGDELEQLVEEARDRAVARVVEVTGLGEVVAEHPEVLGVIRGFAGLAEATTREWLRHGRLTRKQTQVLLENALLRIVRDVVPKVIAACDREGE